MHNPSTHNSVHKPGTHNATVTTRQKAALGGLLSDEPRPDADATDAWRGRWGALQQLPAAWGGVPSPKRSHVPVALPGKKEMK